MGATSSGAKTFTKRQPYRCYMLRCWLEEGAGPNGEALWRFTVQQTGPGAARRSFACLKDVEAYLEAEFSFFSTTPGR